MRRRFRRVTSFKPKSSRAESKETFMWGSASRATSPASGVTEEQQAHAAQPA